LEGSVSFYERSCHSQEMQLWHCAYCMKLRKLEYNNKDDFCYIDYEPGFDRVDWHQRAVGNPPPR